MAQSDSSILYKYKVGDDEMKDMYDRKNSRRNEQFDLYKKIHFDIVEITSEDEWNQLYKAIKKLKIKF